MHVTKGIFHGTTSKLQHKGSLKTERENIISLQSEGNSYLWNKETVTKK